MTELPVWAPKGVGFKVLGILGGVVGAAVGESFFAGGVGSRQRSVWLTIIRFVEG
jgi:hypothetical protein